MMWGEEEKRQKNPNRVFTPEEEADLIEMKKAGKSGKEMADKHNLYTPGGHIKFDLMAKLWRKHNLIDPAKSKAARIKNAKKAVAARWDKAGKGKEKEVSNDFVLQLPSITLRLKMEVGSVNNVELGDRELSLTIK